LLPWVLNSRCPVAGSKWTPLTVAVDTWLASREPTDTLDNVFF
jgi:hypothetical protein